MAKEKAAKAKAATAKQETPTKEEENRKESRALAPLRPPAEVGRFRREMDRLFEDLMRPAWLSAGSRRWPDLFGRWAFGEPEREAPVLDVYEDKDAVVVKAELPGMSKDDIQVSVTGDVLTVRGEKKREKEVHEEDYYCRERSYGAFSRSIRLPVEVQGEKVKATFKNGVLEMRLPKTEEAKRKSVSVKVG